MSLPPSTALIEVPAEQRRTKVYRHPDRDLIIALLRRGKTGDWIAKWLESRYPIEDQFGAPHEDADENERHRLSARMIDAYRSKWMPECRPGVDAILPELEDKLGRRIGVADDMGPQYELEVLETVINVAQKSLGMALAQSADLEMLAGITLEAQGALLDAVKLRFEIAAKLGRPGYELAAVQRQQIKQDVKQTTKNLNVEVQGVMDRRGQVHPVDPPKIAAMKQLLAMDDDQREATIHAAERVARDIDGTATDVPDG